MLVAGLVYRRFPRFGEVRRVAFFGVIAAGIGLGGCGISFPMASLMPEEPESTNSLKKKPVSPLSPELGLEDWRRAKSALAVALDPQGNGSPVSWDNPETGFDGSFTPVGQPFVKADEICRAFLTTIAGRERSSSLQGTACRPSGGEWVVKDVKAWKKPG
jgi:17 kDa outer membrane surface antigen